MARNCESPIVDRFETWALVNEYKLHWGRDESGEMWVAVENRRGDCEGFLPYAEYLCHGHAAACCVNADIRYGASSERR